MRSFCVDDEVVAVVWARAKPRPFESLTFNNALRRTLGIPEAPELDGDSARGDAQIKKPDDLALGPNQNSQPDQPAGRRRAKAPRADLRRLMREGFLRNGEELFVVDYQRQRIQHSKVTIAGAYLQHEGRVHSMSDLARELLKREGYRSDSVRGPAHWVNAADESIKDLWQRILDNVDARP